MTAGVVPLVLLTGFLGAGKTTLLNRLLREPALARSAVMVNELGEIGIDHLLVEQVDGDHLTLSTGCICCAARGDLVDALTGLIGRRAMGIGFDRIVIEATGLADPRPILEALALDPRLSEACRLEAVLTVVDGLDGLDMLSRMPEAPRQAALADLLVLSKLDLVAEGKPAPDLARRLGELNPSAPVVDGRDLEAVIIALGYGERLRGLREADAPEHHPHQGRHADVSAVVLRAGAVEETVFEAFLTVLVERHGESLLRLKGLVATPDDPARPHLVQMVGRRIQPGRRLDAWPDADHGTRLVAIVEGVPRETVAQLWADMVGPPAIDRPDAAALVHHRQGGAGLL